MFLFFFVLKSSNGRRHGGSEGIARKSPIIEPRLRKRKRKRGRGCSNVLLTIKGTIGAINKTKVKCIHIF